MALSDFGNLSNFERSKKGETREAHTLFYLNWGFGVLGFWVFGVLGFGV